MEKITSLAARKYARLCISPAKAIRWFIIFSVGITVGGFAIGALVLLYTGYNDRQQAAQALTNLALVVEREIDSQIALWDLSLQRYLEAKIHSKSEHSDVGVWQNAVVPGPLTNINNFGPFIMLDDTGNVVDASIALGSSGSNFAGQDYFFVHQQRTEIGLYFSGPFRNRLQNGELSIAISRRLPSEGGRFRGVVFGILPLSHFEHLFDGIKLGPQGSVKMFRFAGGNFVLYPVNVTDINGDSDNTFSASKSLQTSSEIVVATHGPEGMKHLHAFCRIGELPLMLDISVSINGIATVWSTAVTAIASILGTLCCLNLMLCRLLRLEWAQRLLRENQFLSIARKNRSTAAHPAHPPVAEKLSPQ